MRDNETILIVEDEAIIADHLQELLRKNGYNALVALDTGMARELLTKEVDLVLVDMNMEERTSGLKLGKEIFSKHKIPFIYITANSEPVLLQKALDTLPASYLTKPFNSTDVIASVKLALHRKAKPGLFVEIREGSNVIRFKKISLKYAVTDGNYIRLVTTGESYLIRITMTALMQLLDSEDFYRTHRTVAVNIHFVGSYSLHHVQVEDREFPLSRSRKKRFVEIMEQTN